jgi:hypothetical protein
MRKERGEERRERRETAPAWPLPTKARQRRRWAL